MFKYTTNPKEAHFFIQTKGNNSGQPLREKIPNCIGVQVNEQYLVPDYFYYIILYLFNTGAFARRLRGSVIPYLRQGDITEAIIDFYING